VALRKARDEVAEAALKCLAAVGRTWVPDAASGTALFWGAGASVVPAMAATERIWLPGITPITAWIGVGTWDLLTIILNHPQNQLPLLS